MDPLPPAPGPFTVYDNIVACGISDIVAPAALGTSPAQRVSSEIFGNVFSNCLIMTDDDIKSYIKSMNDMTIGEGRVKFSPSVARYLKAFIQFICDRMRKDLPPDTVLYHQVLQPQLISQHQAQKRFMDDSETLSKAAKPTIFKTGVKWHEWFCLFTNYMEFLFHTLFATMMWQTAALNLHFWMSMWLLLHLLERLLTMIRELYLSC